MTAEHLRTGVEYDAALIWTEDATKDSFKVCLREMQNFDGKHEDITVVSSLVFEKVVGRWYFGIKRKQLAQIDNYFNRSFNIITVISTWIDGNTHGCFLIPSDETLYLFPYSTLLYSSCIECFFSTFTFMFHNSLLQYYMIITFRCRTGWHLLNFISRSSPNMVSSNFQTQILH